MDEVKSFDLKRIEHALESLPDANIIIISNKLIASEIFKKRLLQHVDCKRNIKFISNHQSSLDGINFNDSIVFLYGYWWENKNAVNFIENFSMIPSLVIPITHVPSLNFKKGGDDNRK